MSNLDNNFNINNANRAYTPNLKKGEETVDGSIKKALKDAKDYTDAALAWVEVY